MPHSVYLHIPFCTHRCAYCDFNTYAGQGLLIPAYVEALRAETSHVGAHAPNDLTVHTVFFGGGTPSLLAPDQFAAILQSLQLAFALVPEAEITIEANPGTVSFPDLQRLRKLGINRISFGVQSSNGEELRMLERQHSYGDVLQAVSAARRAGFENLNVDLIYGLPQQELRTWQTTLRRALELRPKHVSAYALTLEHGTPFGNWASRGLLAAPDPDLTADMYEWASLELESAGYTQYEISNWAIKDHECVHNLQYWRGLPYLGLGAGAHGFAGGYRYSNVLGIPAYISRMSGGNVVDAAPGEESGFVAGIGGAVPRRFPVSPAAVEARPLTTEDDRAEFMIMGLRLTREGISAAAYQARFGRPILDDYSGELNELVGLGLLEWVVPQPVPAQAHDNGNKAVDAGSIRLTSRGRLLGNQVFVRFVR